MDGFKTLEKSAFLAWISSIVRENIRHTVACFLLLFAPNYFFSACLLCALRALHLFAFCSAFCSVRCGVRFGGGWRSNIYNYGTSIGTSGDDLLQPRY